MGEGSKKSFNGATSRNTFIDFGTRPNTGNSGKKSLYFDVGQELKNLVFVRYEGKQSSSNTRVLFGSNDPDDENSWVELHRAKEINGPNDSTYPPYTNGSTAYRYFCFTDTTNMSVDNFGIDDTVFDQQAKVISTDLVNNTMTVDGGEWLGTDGSATDGVDLGWNQSETWTDYATNANFSKVFDGNDATYVANIGNPVTYTYTGKLTGKVEVTIGNFKNLLGSGETYELNSSGNVVTISPTEFDVWKEIGTLDDEAMSITITGLSGNSALISGIKVDGQRLVDPTIAGAPNPIGDNHVEYQTNGGQGDIISTDPDTNTLVIADTGDRDNRWIKGFSVAGPSVIDTPLLTNDVELRGSDFATTPADADTLKEIVWSINGTEYSAGVTNPLVSSGEAAY